MWILRFPPNFVKKSVGTFAFWCVWSLCDSCYLVRLDHLCVGTQKRGSINWTGGGWHRVRFSAPSTPEDHRKLSIKTVLSSLSNTKDKDWKKVLTALALWSNLQRMDILLKVWISQVPCFYGSRSQAGLLDSRLPCQRRKWQLGQCHWCWAPHECLRRCWKTNYRVYSYTTEKLSPTCKCWFSSGPQGHPFFFFSIFGHCRESPRALICALKNPGKYKCVSGFVQIFHPVFCPWG